MLIKKSQMIQDRKDDRIEEKIDLWKEAEINEPLLYLAAPNG